MTTKDTHHSPDSDEYRQKKALYSQLLTIFGRKPVLEALEDDSLNGFRLHLAKSNKTQGIIKDIVNRAQQRQIDIVYHDRQALSRISKNGKQDQGVCLDIHCPQFCYYDTPTENDQTKKAKRLLAIEKVTNPQNLGMIIRSACAGAIDGILIPQKGCARLDSLVIKASAGTLFKAPLILCKELEQALSYYQKKGAKVVGLTGSANKSLQQIEETQTVIYVVGNETDGLSDKLIKQCDDTAFIPMNNGVESLNVAVAASLVAFRPLL